MAMLRRVKVCRVRPLEVIVHLQRLSEEGTFSFIMNIVARSHERARYFANKNFHTSNFSENEILVKKKTKVENLPSLPLLLSLWL